MILSKSGLLSQKARDSRGSSLDWQWTHVSKAKAKAKAMVSIHFSNTLNALKPPPHISAFKPSSFLYNKFPNQRKITKYTTFRAEFSHDAPFAAAIGACMLSSLVLPPVSTGAPGDDADAGSGIDTTDARFAVMGVVSFIPYFNWLVKENPFFLCFFGNLLKLFVGYFLISVGNWNGRVGFLLGWILGKGAMQCMHLCIWSHTSGFSFSHP